MVQVVILAENNEIREKLQQYDIHIQTIADAAPIEVQPARVLSHLYTYLGKYLVTVLKKNFLTQEVRLKSDISER